MLSSAMLFRKNLQLLFLLTVEQISCSAESSMKKKRFIIPRLDHPLFFIGYVIV